MWQDILIIVLGLCTLVLAVLLWRRHKLERKAIFVETSAVESLINAFGANIRVGKIQNVAGQVSDILRNHLKCHKIVFLKNFRDHLELNYFSGLKGFPRQRFRIRLNKEIKNGLRQFDSVDHISCLGKVLGKSKIDWLSSLDLNLFFPVYVRDNLYGLYLISTDLDKNNKALRLLSSALALNLSTAYHIAGQEKKLQYIQDKNSKREINDFQNRSLIIKKLPAMMRIKDSRKLTGELMDILRQECEITRMVFHANHDKNDDSVVSINWNLDDASRESIKKALTQTDRNFGKEQVTDLRRNVKSSHKSQPAIDSLQRGKIDFVTALPWTNGQKAIFGWSSKKTPSQIASRLKSFRNEAVPIIENALRLERAEEMSYTDGLTDVYNFRFFQKRFEEEFNRARRYKHHLSLLIIDIDDLKVINDNYGHQSGDEILIAFANLIRESVRTNDIVSRYGGDEFCLIMPETDKNSSGVFMERLRQKIELSPVILKDSKRKIEYSVSIGGAVYPSDANNKDDLIRAADMALLSAKSSGRNCSQMFDPAMTIQPS